MSAGQTVVITGALGDIGRALARTFAADGASLALCDLPAPSEAEGLLAGLAPSGGRVMYRVADVTDPAAMARFVGEAVERFGGVDLAIPNAGIVERGALVDLPVAAWRRTLDVNLTGAFVTAQASARAMLRGGRGGQIIFISSWVQDHPRAGIGAYCASKGGLKQLAKCLALELAPAGIRVNLVAPGWVDAGLTGQNLQRNPELETEIRRQIPLDRLASADDVARAVRMLGSADAAYMTGATLLVDGGSSLGYRRAEMK